MGFNGPQINRTNGNLNTLPPNKDRVLAYVAGGVATADLPLNTPKRVVSIDQVETLGINAAYDANNGVLIYDDLSELFRLSPSAEAIIMITARPDGTTGNEIKDWFNTGGVVDTMLRQEVCSDVKFVFTKFNPDGITPTFTNNGLADEVLAAVPFAQQLVDAFFDEKRYLHGIMLDGWKMQNVADLETLRDLLTPQLSIVGAVDGYILDNFNSIDDKTAVGAVMGMYAVRGINEDLGSVELLNPPPRAKGQESYPLNNGVRWPYAALINGENINVHSMAVQDDMTAKGLIFAGKFNGYDGFFLNGDPTCTDETSDYAWINNNCVWSTAATLVRQGMIPKVRSVLKKDPQTGYLTETTAKAVEQAGQRKLNQLLERDLVSAAKVFLDAKQTPSSTVPLTARVEVVKDGILYQLDIDLGLYNQISA